MGKKQALCQELFLNLDIQGIPTTGWQSGDTKTSASRRHAQCQVSGHSSLFSNPSKGPAVKLPCLAWCNGTMALGRSGKSWGSTFACGNRYSNPPFEAKLWNTSCRLYLHIHIKPHSTHYIHIHFHSRTDNPFCWIPAWDEVVGWKLKWSIQGLSWVKIIVPWPMQKTSPNPGFAHTQTTHPNNMIYISPEDAWKHWFFAVKLTLSFQKFRVLI